MKIITKFELGDKFRCIVTGLEGVADQIRVLLNGCVQYSIQPHGLDKDGKMKTSYWVDEQQLEKLTKGINDKPVKRDSSTGGPTEINNSY